LEIKMKATKRTKKSSAVLDASKNEKLTYVLKRRGPGADFVMTDEDSDETTPAIFSEENLGGSLESQYTWELRSAVLIESGQQAVRLTFHRANGTRLGSHQHLASDPNGFHFYTFVMTFMFLGTYTLVVNRCDSEGQNLATIVDMDFEGEQHTDTATNAIRLEWRGLAS
jgi:hypothetical protein